MMVFEQEGNINVPQLFCLEASVQASMSHPKSLYTKRRNAEGQLSSGSPQSQCCSILFYYNYDVLFNIHKYDNVFFSLNKIKNFPEINEALDTLTARLTTHISDWGHLVKVN